MFVRIYCRAMMNKHFAYRERREAFASEICSLCFQNNRHDEGLLFVRCRKPHQHHIHRKPLLVTWSAKKHELVEIRPLPSSPLDKGGYVMCTKPASCPGIDRCTYAHSEEEMVVWNTRLDDERRHRAAVQAQASHEPWHANFSHGKRKSKYHNRREPNIEHAKATLTQQTYQSKFYSLLCYEEKEHIDLLSKRCNGEYQLTVFKKGELPPGVRKGNPFSRYGCLSGISGDKVMYATQASECLFIVDQSGEQICVAGILPDNAHGLYDGMLIDFKDEDVRALERHKLIGFQSTVSVKFEVKHFYFDLLHESLDSLCSAQKIYKVMPLPSLHDHRTIPMHRLTRPPDSYEFLGLDEQSQIPALTKVVNSNSRDPVLISGAFGTGKTRLLAVATYHFIEQGRQNGVPTRVLIACHHQVTADTFIEEYFGRMIGNRSNRWKVELVRITRAHYSAKHKYSRVYLNLYDFRKEFSSKYANEDFVVVVTTLLTALKVRDTIKDKFFTHVLLDEAAQAREPEAIAPLSMANQNTKVVIAGDDRQVGPEILVLGDIARENGLKKSLFTRLAELYKDRNMPIAVLSTNYRCHKEIVFLARSLFYSERLKPLAKLNSIPGVPHPIWFVCSSLAKAYRIDHETDPEEAAALIKQLKAFFEPEQTEDVCIMATNRHQLSDIKAALLKQKTSFIPTQFVPTYLIQGEEFKALFMSTAEALDPLGCSLNPTKSLCSPSVFNTAITRAKSLIVAVGNPYILMRMEKKMGNNKQCWAEYLNKCFEMGTLVRGEGITEDAIQDLHEFVKRRLQPITAPPPPIERPMIHNVVEKKTPGQQQHDTEAVVLQQVLDHSDLLQQQLKYVNDRSREKDGEINELQLQLQHTAYMLKQEQQKTVDKEEKLQESEQAIRDKEEAHQQLQQLFDLSQKSVRAANGRAENAQQRIREMEEKLREKTHVLEEQQHKIEEVKAGHVLEEQQQVIREKEELQMTVNALQEQQQMTREKERERLEADQAYKDQQQRTKEKEKELQEMTCAYEEQQQKTREKEEELRELEEQQHRTRQNEEELRETVRANEQRIREKEEELQETRRTLERSQQTIREKDEENRAMRQQVQQLQAQGVQPRVQQVEQCHWVVRRDEIEMTNEEVGRGGWGVVMVAKFRGLRVATKCLHGVIISSYNRRKFSREMTIAAELRHPNLLLFIGAIMEGEPVIITELMPTSLRKELEKGNDKLVNNQVISIVREVCCGLNYMHRSRPHPIIHRDISSGNVLLEPLPNGWRAKISDYGSANFINQIGSTIGPGSPAYSAPEAPYPDHHSIKMDVFSLGVLMVEMCLGELPEST